MFFDSTKLPMLALVEVGSVFELCFFFKGASQGRQDEP